MNKPDLQMTRALADEMIEHCRAGVPNEACGILGAKNGEIVKVFRMTNASGSPVRYSLDPKEQFAVYNTLDQEGWDLGGVFHSHTHTDPYPSPTDVAAALFPQWHYVLVSLRDEAPMTRSYRIVDGKIAEEPVVVIP